MSGVAGIIFKDESNFIHKSTCYTILQSMRHRGVDDYGLFIHGKEQNYLGKDIRDFVNVKSAFFYTHFSKSNLPNNVNQPIISRDGCYVLVFDGEIFNCAEIKSELLALGHDFVMKTNAEILLYAYITWKEKILERLEGSFSFVIFNILEQTVFMARDPFGIKPLYYAVLPGKIIFASEIKTILLFPEVSRAGNPQLIYDHLIFGITDCGKETMIKSINQVAAAHYVKFFVKREGIPKPLEQVRYWQTPKGTNLNISFNEAAEQIRFLFLKNIKKHLNDNVLIGVGLSGGIDSSSIVSSMRYLEPDMPIHTFSYIDKSEELSETKWVNIVNNYNKTNSHKIYINSYELMKDLDDLINTQDIPFGSTSIYAGYRVFKAAKEKGIRIILDGQGGDTLFGGLTNHLAYYVVSLFKNFNIVKAIKVMFYAKTQYNIDVFQFLIVLAPHIFNLRIQNLLRQFFHKSFKPKWLNASWLEQNAITQGAVSLAKYKKSLLSQIKSDIEKTSLSSWCLRYRDRNSMRFSIECGLPFLTTKFVDYVLSLPDEFFITHKANTRAVFKKAMEGIVPKEILERKDKIGFDTSELVWLKKMDPWIQKTLSEITVKDFPLLDINVVKSWWEQTKAGTIPFDRRSWRLFNLIRWVQLNKITF